MKNRGSDWFRRPELILSELLQDAARGTAVDRHYRRAVVLAVDHVGGSLQNANGEGTVSVTSQDGSQRKFAALIGPTNPRGSVKARILTDGFDRLIDDADCRVFWPLFSPDQLGFPVSPGEHIYVIFEGDGLDHGLWVTRVSGQDSANAFNGVDSYREPSAPRSAMDSFEPNEPEYERTDDAASLAPPRNPMDLFVED